MELNKDKTIYYIAKVAGVAKSTVSAFKRRILWVMQRKRRFRKVINENDYIPNPFAQSLKAKQTNMIGTRFCAFHAASRTLIGIDEQLKEHGYQLIISNTSQSLEREIESIYNLANQKVDAIILLATEITDAHVKAFEMLQTPVLLIGQEHEEFHCVIHDDYEAGFEMGKYVLNKGHRKIAS